VPNAVHYKMSVAVYTCASSLGVLPFTTLYSAATPFRVIGTEYRVSSSAYTASAVVAAAASCYVIVWVPHAQCVRGQLPAHCIPTQSRTCVDEQQSGVDTEGQLNAYRELLCISSKYIFTSSDAAAAAASASASAVSMLVVLLRACGT
jgi:hypothetical protein